MTEFTSDTYKTIETPSEEVLYKEKNSKFFGYAFPVTNEDEVKEIINQLKKQHYSARHWCYAFQTGIETLYYRANDDGEPNNSAGAPIYGQIQSFNVTNILIVVVRYFGGTKLGVGGLISAYKTTAQMALENSQIIEKTIDVHFQLNFDYKDMNKVMRVVRENQLNIISQKMEMNCEMIIATRKQNEGKIASVLASLFEITSKKCEF